MAEMPKVSQAHLDARRAEILEGARRAFARHGYEGATVARLEEETGLSRGAIFHYFDGKLDLFAALASSDNLRYQALLAEEGLDAVLRAIAEANPEWLSVLIETEVKLLHDPAFVERIAATPEQRERLLDAFRRRQAEGVFRADFPAEELARFATIVINGLALRVAGGETTSIDAVLTLVNDALRPRD
jgi:TetR/AcrR family transcriptional regulator, transcriptional repressor of aconitase